jgi:hypothetical protein
MLFETLRSTSRCPGKPSSAGASGLGAPSAAKKPGSPAKKEAELEKRKIRR